MLIEERLFSWLSSHLSFGDRVYAAYVPQGTQLPFCVFEKTSNHREYSHTGFSGIQRSVFQIDCYGATYMLVKGMSFEVINIMEAWPSSKQVQAVFAVGESDIYMVGTDSHRIPIDFEIFH